MESLLNFEFNYNGVKVYCLIFPILLYLYHCASHLVCDHLSSVILRRKSDIYINKQVGQDTFVSNLPWFKEQSPRPPMGAFWPFLPLHGGLVHHGLKSFYYVIGNNVLGSHSPALPCEWAMVMQFQACTVPMSPQLGELASLLSTV